MSTPHVIASSSGHPSPSVSNNGIVGGHYKVGKKIGEGSFGVVFEGWSLSSPFIQCTLVVVEFLLSVFIGRRSVMRFHFK
jgi:serine/threonine protein kinase